MIVQWKDVKKQNSKTKKLFFVGKDFHKNLSQRLYHWGTQGKEKNSKLQRNFFHEKSIPQKIIPKIVSKIVFRKDNRKQKPKLKNLISLENHAHKNISQRSYQWGYTGKISKCITQK